GPAPARPQPRGLRGRRVGVAPTPRRVRPPRPHRVDGPERPGPLPHGRAGASPLPRTRPPPPPRAQRVKAAPHGPLVGRRRRIGGAEEGGEGVPRLELGEVVLEPLPGEVEPLLVEEPLGVFAVLAGADEPEGHGRAPERLAGADRFALPGCLASADSLPGA